jgi:hypothetical protein
LQVLQEGIIPVLERQLFKCCRTYVQIISDSLFKFAGLRTFSLCSFGQLSGVQFEVLANPVDIKVYRGG